MRRSGFAAVLALGAAAAWGDGAFMPPALTGRVTGASGVASTEQKGVVIELPRGREALLLQTTYQGPADRFAWVIPVPGKPAKEDVFLASTDFIDALLNRTRPEVRTEIVDPRDRRHRGHARARMEAPGPAGGAPAASEALAPEPTVTVHERMPVGQYDAAVLSATGAEVLNDWLTRNGFLVPEGAEEILNYYVQKRWYFVALKIQPGQAERRPLLQDVSPIGIRFETKQLVYPLHISRASSREKTAMLLLVLSNAPVACDQLPEAALPLGRWSRKGTSYATLRRKALEGPRPAAVCEYGGPEGLFYYDLYYQKDAWSGPEGEGWSPGFLWTTRLFTLLRREQLEDLTFSPSSDRRTVKLVVSRRGEIHRSLFERATLGEEDRIGWLASAGALIFLLAAWAANRGFSLSSGRIAGYTAATFGLLGFLVVLGVAGEYGVALVSPLFLVLLTSRQRDTTAAERLSPADLVRGALVAAGLGAGGQAAWMLLTGNAGFLHADALGRFLSDLWSGEASPTVTLLTMAAQLVWIVLVVDLVHRGLAGAGWRAAWVAAPWLGLALLAALVLFQGGYAADLVGHLRPQETGLRPGRAALAAATVALSATTFLALLLVPSFLIAGPLTAPNARRLAQPLSQTLLVLVILSAVVTGVGISQAHAGTGGVIASGARELDQSLNDLDAMLARFRNANGCYPAKLEDLVRGQTPQEGLDSSGNVVKIGDLAPAGAAPPAGAKARSTSLPVDVLTGRSDTWVYEPTGTPIIDSGGYQIKIEVADTVSPGNIARWQPGRPLAHSGPTPTMPRYYWQGDRPVALPFASSFALEGPFTRQRVAGSADMVRRFVRTREGPALFVVSVRDQAASFPSGPRTGAADALDVSADGRRVIYACNSDRSTMVGVVGITDWQPKRVPNRPWPVEVYDVAWRPGHEEWLVTARDLKGDERGRLYLLSPHGPPRAITELQPFVGAKFAPDGNSILALIAEDRWYGSDSLDGRLLHHRAGPPPDWPATAAVWRLSLDGKRQGKLAESVDPRLVFASHLGWLGVVPAPGGDGSLLLADRAGVARQLPLPHPNAWVVETWVGEGEVVIGLLGPDSRKMSHPDRWADVGEVWASPLPEPKWRLIARWALASTQRRADRESNLRVVGRDAATGAYVLALRHGEGYRVYAVRDGEPRLQLLPDDLQGNARQPFDVDVAGEKRRVVLDGYYWIRAFQPGDLITRRAERHLPDSALPVAERTANSLLVGEQRLPLADDEVPLIGGPQSDCYAKLKRQ